MTDLKTNSPGSRWLQRASVLWGYAFAIYSALAVVLATQTYYWQLADSAHPDFRNILILSLLNFWIYALLTPPVLWLCERYPIQRPHLASRILLHFFASVLFVVIHVTLRIAIYPVRMQGQIVPVTSTLWRQLFLYFVFDSIVNVYAMIALFGHLMLYYRNLRERELRSAQLEGKLARAQLSMLRMQMHPHFLFNTLNAVSAMARDNPRGAEEMLARLGSLLRQTLDNESEQEVPLRAELELVGQYLEIEQVRFADRLRVSIDPAPDTLDALVPNMFLQPLVENALRHGIGRKAEGGSLEMRSWREGDDLSISLRDSGPGFGEAAIPANQGIGLSNTRSRLEHLYPGSHSLQIGNAPDGGARVLIKIPFRTQTVVGSDNDLQCPEPEVR